MKQLTTTCVDAKGEDIEEMVEEAFEMDHADFIWEIGQEQQKELNETFGYAQRGERGLKLKDDYAVSFHSSHYKGKPCVYMVHSAIEYVFV